MILENLFEMNVFVRLTQLILILQINLVVIHVDKQTIMIKNMQFIKHLMKRFHVKSKEDSWRYRLLNLDSIDVTFFFRMMTSYGSRMSEEYVWFYREMIKNEKQNSYRHIYDHSSSELKMLRPYEIPEKMSSLRQKKKEMKNPSHDQSIKNFKYFMTLFNES